MTEFHMGILQEMVSPQEDSSSASSGASSSDDSSQVVPDFPSNSSDPDTVQIKVEVIPPMELTIADDPQSSAISSENAESDEEPTNSATGSSSSSSAPPPSRVTPMMSEPVVIQYTLVEPKDEPQTTQLSTREAAMLLASLGQKPKDTPSKKKSKSSGGVKLPINSIEDLDALEREIEENEMSRVKLLTRLGTIGGKNSGQCVRNALKALLTDAVAVQLNWAGRGGKKPFQNYEIKTVLFDAVRMNFPKVTDFELKDPVQCWLKRSRNYLPNKK